jgi:NAD(P)-dependent dehydrogenase (short-subunit alcohol dehydrogenase family)
MSGRRLRALVTGCASGIGLAVTERLRERGDEVLGIDYQSGGDWLVADLGDEAQREAAARQALHQLGAVDVLVNVVGIYLPTTIEENRLADWRKVWAVNLEAPLQLSGFIFPQMQQQNFGRIVNISSVHANFSRPDCLAYDVAKGGLESATRSLALSGAKYGILVNAVAPGFVRTNMSLNEEGVDEADTPQFHDEFVVTARLPLRRAAQAVEIAEAVEWLASERNTYVTGQVLTADGGLTATL